MEKKRARSGKGGFTLLETVMALSIAAMAAVFAVGFLHPQIQLYYEFDRKSQAKVMCGQAYMELEKKLRYGYMYSLDAGKPEELAYYVRRDNPGTVEEDGTVYEKLPPVKRWPRISADTLDVDVRNGMNLKLDFSGSSGREARVKIQIIDEDEVVFQQDTLIQSMYDYHVETEGDNGR